MPNKGWRGVGIGNDDGGGVSEENGGAGVKEGQEV